MSLATLTLLADADLPANQTSGTLLSFTQPAGWEKATLHLRVINGTPGPIQGRTLKVHYAFSEDVDIEDLSLLTSAGSFTFKLTGETGGIDEHASTEFAVTGTNLYAWIEVPESIGQPVMVNLSATQGLGSVNCVFLSGSPEGVIDAPKGAWAFNVDEQEGTPFWLKTTGSGNNSGWIHSSNMQLIAV